MGSRDRVKAMGSTAAAQQGQGQGHGQQGRRGRVKAWVIAMAVGVRTSSPEPLPSLRARSIQEGPGVRWGGEHLPLALRGGGHLPLAPHPQVKPTPSLLLAAEEAPPASIMI